MFFPEKIRIQNKKYYAKQKAKKLLKVNEDRHRQQNKKVKTSHIINNLGDVQQKNKLYDECVSAYETKLKRLTHRHCEICHSVSLNISVSSNIYSTFVCSVCKDGKLNDNKVRHSLPTWIDDNGTVQYKLPTELSTLREGEKLLIAQISVYIPLFHLKAGQLGSKGHVCSFPQVSTIRTILYYTYPSLSNFNFVLKYLTYVTSI